MKENWKKKEERGNVKEVEKIRKMKLHIRMKVRQKGKYNQKREERNKK